MAALRSRCGHYIFALVVSSIYLLLFCFLAQSQPSQIGCLPWCDLSANLGCRFETSCTRLAENTGRKKSPFGHHRTTLSGYIFATKACIDRHSEKNLLNNNTFCTCLRNMVNFGPLAAEIGSGVSGTPLQISTGFASLQHYYTRYSGSGHEPNFAAFNRGRHLYWAGRPSRWSVTWCV